jgi:acyl-CoA synthetase (NDP forming)
MAGPDSDLGPFFEPRGVAIIGARSSPGFGYGIPLRLKQLGWGDRTFQVNPRGGELHGMPVYPAVSQVPDPVDLAVVIVPGPAVPATLAEIGRRGIRHVIIESAGFAETGAEGRARQNELLAVAREHGLRVIGPNCVGVVNTANKFTTSEVMAEALTPGRLAVIAQSGVFGHNLLDKYNEQGVYISKTVTLGNRLDVNENEVLDFLHQDPQTDLVSMYLEGAADGRRLVETLKRVTRDKPVLILKSGRTPVGRAATASHTGSLSGEDRLYESMFAQTGAVRAESVNDLVDFARVFLGKARPRGPRLAIVTGSGSMGALAADTAYSEGLVLPPLPHRVFTRVKEGAPGWMNAANPLDVGPSGRFPTAFRALMEDPDIDMVLSIVTTPYAVVETMPQEFLSAERFLGEVEPIRELAKEKPLAICVLSHRKLVDLIKEAVSPDIPVYTTPEPPVRALAALWRWQRQRNQAARGGNA